MEEETHKIVLAGGGTGGHLYPALSVADELKRRRPRAAIIFVGSARGLEQRLVPQAGYPLLTLRLSGLKGATVIGKLGAAAAAGWAVARCTLWMRRHGPDLVIGVGGFASGPAVLAANVLNIRTMVMEQNHYPGATNRWLAPRVDVVCLPSEAARTHIGGRTLVTGNPVRPEFLDIGEPPGRETLSVLVFGGSRGARSINRSMIAALAALARIDPPPRIVHQTGPADLAEVETAYASYAAGLYEVRAFFDDMAARFAAADLVVCRAGASTLAELCAAGRPAILVPYPFAADDHQRRNAEMLRDAGAAIVIGDAELGGDDLSAAIERFAGDREHARAMGRAARTLAHPHAASRIADVAERLMDGGHDVS